MSNFTKHMEKQNRLDEDDIIAADAAVAAITVADAVATCYY